MSKEKKEKIIKPKPRNHGTMTEAAFWQSIRSQLRKVSRWWKPIVACKEANRRPNQSSNKRLKWEFMCNSCKNWFPDAQIKVDHIQECGSLNCAEDAGGFIERLFCEVDGLQCLCEECHNIKTAEYKKQLKENKNEEL